MKFQPRDKVTISRPAASIDAAGGRVEAFLPFIERFAEVDYSARPSTLRDGTTGNYSCRVRVWYDHDTSVLQQGDRLEVMTRGIGRAIVQKYRIASALPAGLNNGQFMDLYCETIP